MGTERAEAGADCTYIIAQMCSLRRGGQNFSFPQTKNSCPVGLQDQETLPGMIFEHE
jgi:hypothetical protein